MALKRLLSLIAEAGIEPRAAALARWTDTEGSAPEEPEYGAFVDEAGRVVTGSQPYRAFLESSDPSQLEVAPAALALFRDATLVFIDWGRQNLSWEEIFELWEAWESQGMILDCGAVGVSWDLASQWVCPGWVAFKEGFDGAPLSTTVKLPPKAPSFLARASALLANADPDSLPVGNLPMLPFTIEDLKNPLRVWPTGSP